MSVLAIVGWAAARQIRSPAQVAADTAAPPAAPITIPAVRRTLATEVIVRGTVRYGAPEAVVLATSVVKQGSSDITTRPPRRQAKLRVGEVAMTVDGRPVFVLPGTLPMHRDLRPGDTGPDVGQLEQALSALGFGPGAVDGRYDATTESAVASFYLQRGWDPFTATPSQLDQLRTAEAAAATARDTHLQAIAAVEQAQKTTRPADVTQARIDAVTARDAVNGALLRVSTSQAKLEQSRTVAAGAATAAAVANANAQRDQALADADVAAKRNAYNAAVNEARLATIRLNETPLDAPPSEREAASLAVGQAADAAAQAQGDLNASIAVANAARAAGAADLQRVNNDAAKSARDVKVAAADLRNARRTVGTARRRASLSALKARILARPTDTRTLQAIVGATAQEEARTRADVNRLARQSGVQVPANEIVFLRNLPVRIDAVKAKRGSTVSGRVMNVTNSRLAVDSSLAVGDAKLVHVGDHVAIEDQDLGIKTRGIVRQVAATPGTNRVDPSRFYLQVVPTAGGPSSLVGSSVKLTIAVRSTKGAVLAVPVSALSVDGSGNSRVAVRRRGRTEIVTVVPGLAARGLVEVRAVRRGRLRPGDLVIVGSRR